MDFFINNWLYLLFAGACAYMMFRGGGCCGGHSHRGHDHSEQDHPEHYTGNNRMNSGKPGNRIDMLRDPVCGMYIDPDNAIKEEIGGKTYYFCSESCKEEFIKAGGKPVREEVS